MHPPLPSPFMSPRALGMAWDDAQILLLLSSSRTNPPPLIFLRPALTDRGAENRRHANSKCVPPPLHPPPSLLPLLVWVVVRSPCLVCVVIQAPPPLPATHTTGTPKTRTGTRNEDLRTAHLSHHLCFTFNFFWLVLW